MNENNGQSFPLSMQYDQNIGTIIPYYHQIHDEITNIVRTWNDSPQTWLDTGCGTGTLVRKALNIFPKTQFYLVDPSSAMLDQAFLKIPDERAIFLGQTCTEDLDEITDLNFDVITAVQCHHYLEKDDRIWAVRTCFRHLNKRGIFITSENIRPMTIEGTGLALRYWKDRQEQNGRTSDDVEKHLKRFDTEFFPLTIPEHLKLYTDTGFQVVEILWVSYMQAAFYCIKL